MRIGIDVRYLSHGLVGGVHTYVASFVPALAELATEHQIVLYADAKRPFELAGLPGNVTVRILPYRNPLSSVFNDLFMRRQMARDRLDVVHFPANYGFGPVSSRTVITVHDELNLLPLVEILRGLAIGRGARSPGIVAMMTYLHYCTVAAVRRAHLLLTVSDYARSQIALRSGYDADRIVVAPHGPPPNVRRVEDPGVLAGVRERFGLTRPFVLADALKNPAALVGAWRLLPSELRDRNIIVFFSRRPDPQPVVREAVADGYAVLVLRASSQDLFALYSSAEAFVFPSRFEGFGVPVLEAMMCGAPVIASNRASIPEVAGGAALLAEADDAATLARHISLVLGSRAEATRMRRLGFARAAEFSWSKSAKRILEAYEMSLNPDGPRSAVLLQDWR